jgi:hypothetical protein
MATLDHPLKAGADQLRMAILAANPGITEHIKWNAPSFYYAGQDRVTFRLHPKGALQLIFHRGAKVRADSADFTVEDPSGLLTWLGKDRAIVTLPDLAAVAAQQSSIVELVNQWVEA